MKAEQKLCCDVLRVLKNELINLWSPLKSSVVSYTSCACVYSLYSRWPFILPVYLQMEKKKQENKMRRDQLNDEYLELLEKQRLYFKTVKEFKEVRMCWFFFFFANVNWWVFELIKSCLRSSAQIHWLFWSVL